MTPRFTIDPGEVSVALTIWRSQERAVRAIRFDLAGELPASTSRVATVLRATTTPATAAITLIAGRLESMTLSVNGFRSRVVDEDADSAAALDGRGAS